MSDDSDSQDLSRFAEMGANAPDLTRMFLDWETTEAVAVAAAIRGGASLVHGIQMRDHATSLGM